MTPLRLISSLLTPLLVCTAALLPCACRDASSTGKSAQNIPAADSIATALSRADHYIYLGMYDKAAEALRPAEVLARNEKRQKDLIRICNKYFLLYNDERQYQRALRYISEAAATARRLNDSSEYYRQINNKALVFLSTQNYDSAMLCFDEAKVYARGDRDALSGINTNIADAWFSQGDTRRARTILEQVVADRPSNYHPILNLALITSERGEQARTRSLINAALPAVDTLPRPQRPDFYGQLTSLYLSLGDSVAALRSLMAYLDEVQAVDSAYNADRFRQLSVEYQTEELASQNRILSLELHRRTLSIVVLTLTIALLAALIIVVRRRHKAERRHNELIAEKNRQIIRMERELRDVLKEQVDKRDRELTAYAMERASDSEKRLSLAREAEKAAEKTSVDSDTSDADLRKTLADISRQLRQSDSDAISRDFRVYFDRVHPRFIDSLKELHPRLTNNDLRLCVFLYLGMSTKEIAALLAREIRSVETARLRLRRKLDIAAGVSLSDYLHSLSK